MKEEWCDIIGYEGVYKVSNFGRVYSIRSKKLLSSSPKHNDSYCTVSLYKDGETKIKPIHRLVAIAFLENPNNYPIVHHKDENKQNNKVENLEWCTQKQNVQHCIESGNFSLMKRKRK